jgi:predicted TIM-barrel fold metal-dependent hydrolase
MSAPAPTDAANAWRLATPGAKGWGGSAHPGAADKYVIISVDSHLGPPPALFRERIEKRYIDRLPRVETIDGRRHLVQEGRRPMLLIDDAVDGEDLLRARAGTSTQMLLLGGGASVAERIAHQDADGIDGEVIFPNGPGLMIWSTTDAKFSQAQCRIWNDWAWEVCSPHIARCKPTAAVATADLEGAVAEIQRAAKMGYVAVTLPNKPVWGPADATHPNYNQPLFDPLWAAIQDAGLAICFHVATGTDPRVARGNGGAVINEVVHATAPTLEPVVNLCASGVFERFPKLRFATIEADAGWLPWLLNRMDQVYRRQHMWVRPKLRALPSEYWRAHGAASFCDDPSATLMVEPCGLEDHLMFANDYPHHEGSWPHSAQTIERLMGHLREDTRQKLLGLNAAKFFGFDVTQR